MHALSTSIHAHIHTLSLSLSLSLSRVLSLSLSLLGGRRVALRNARTSTSILAHTHTLSLLSHTLFLSHTHTQVDEESPYEMHALAHLYTLLATYRNYSTSRAPLVLQRVVRGHRARLIFRARRKIIIPAVIFVFYFCVLFLIFVFYFPSSDTGRINPNDCVNDQFITATHCNSLQHKS